MAEPYSKRSKFYCQACDMTFCFKSKYDRHLSSKSHTSHSDFVEALDKADSQYGYSDHPVNSDPEYSRNMQLSGVSDSLQYAGGLSYESGHVSQQFSDTSEDDGSDTEDVNYVDSYTSLLDKVDVHSSNFFPFKSKQHALLYFLCNSPRPIGETNMNFLWYILHGLDGSLPSVATIKRFKLPGFTEPKKFIAGASKIPFYVNDVLNSIRMCLGNPKTASLLHRFPEIPLNHLSELYHGEVWFNDLRMQSISAIYKDTPYFLKDFIKIEYDGQHGVLAKILKFYQKEGRDGVFMEVDVLFSIEQMWKKFPAVSGLYMDDTVHVLLFKDEVLITSIEQSGFIPSSLMHFNQSTMRLVSFTTAEYQHYILPHPKKQSSNGLPIVTVPLVLFTDDTSGNRSKKWNKFEWWGFTLAGLPQAESHKPHQVQFIACSNTVPLLEMAAPITQQLIAAENGFEAYDANLKSNVYVTAPILLVAADNVRHSELLNHMGSKALKFCRMCMVDRKSPTAVSDLRTKELTLTQIENIKKAETEKSKKDLRTSYGIKESLVNPMFDLNMDLHSSTPVETLHTILLGTCKYLLRSFMSKCNQVNKKKILAAMSSFNQSGFSTKVYGNVCYYYQSFVARDFKGWMQQAVFILAPFLTPNELKVWILLAKVFKIAYCEKLCKGSISLYQATCENLVLEISKTYPEHMDRIKVHLLLHLSDDIKKFSHPSCFNTERFEAFNSFVRSQNVYGNKHAPSRDIAHSLGVISYLRFWCCSDQTAQCGDGLKSLFGNVHIQKFFNCLPMKELLNYKAIYQHGTLRKKASVNPIKLMEYNVKVIEDKSSLALRHILKEFSYSLKLPDNELNHDDYIFSFTAVVTGHSAELAKLGDFVKYTENEYGYLAGCFTSKKTKTDYCLINVLERSRAPTHFSNMFECPVFCLTKKLIAISSSSIRNSVSFVHCCSEKCEYVQSSSYKNYERDPVLIDRLCFQHYLNNRNFLFNIYCFNNHL